MPAPDTLPIPPTDRLITALERIAEALDNLAALHAAGPALHATGAGTTVDLTGLMVVGNYQAHPDGWIEWTGGVCPVDPHTKVEWKGRDGTCATDDARDLNWTHKNNGDQIDIVAYRIRKDGQ